MRESPISTFFNVTVKSTGGLGECPQTFSTMSLFAGIKTIKKVSQEPVKIDTPVTSGFNPSQAHGLYNPKQQKVDNTPINESSELGIATVGDGGASWKRRALLRAQEKAKGSGLSLDEVVTDLHGSSAKELAEGAKGARREKWKQRKSFHNPHISGRNEDRRKSDQSDIRGGGLRIGRNARDVDVLARFRGKVKDGFQRSGLNTFDSEGKQLGSSKDTNKKRVREDNFEKELANEKAEFEELLKDSNEQLVHKSTRMKITHSNIWDQEDEDTIDVKAAVAQKVPVSTTGGNQSVAAALRARLKKTPLTVPPPPATSSNEEFDDDYGDDQSGSEIAPLDGKGRRLLALLESDASLDRVQKEDLRKGKWRGKAKGEASAGGGEEGAKKMDITAMAAFEREGGEDMDEVFARNIARLGGRFKGIEDKAGSRAGMDEEEDVDMKMFQSASARVTAKRLVEMQKNKAVAEEKRYSSMMNQSPFSVENPHFKRHLVIARGAHSFVMLMEKKKGLVPGHCSIVALQQAPSARAVQEEVWNEMCEFKKALRRFHGNKGAGVLFLETALKGGRAWGHVECLPVPLECEEDAPLFFNQALSGAESEWSTHKAIIDTARGLRKSIPTGFAYFHVEWARGGCAHIIEDAEEFGADFGRSVVAGMLDIDHGMQTSQGHYTDKELDLMRTEFSPFNPVNP